MDFELKHLDMIQSDLNGDLNESQSNYKRNSTQSSNKSMVLDDLSQQIEDLQSKLKVNYKKIILYETENQKLIQEKNSLFFENKSLVEKNALIQDKNKKLMSYNNEIEVESERLSHINDVSAKLIETQKIDLSRLSKFHLKIKNIVKPFVENLKQKNNQLTQDLAIKTKLLDQKILSEKKLLEQIEELKIQVSTLTKNNAHEKNLLIQGYEEQVHFLSKEVVNEQQKVFDINNENLKLKKQCETKHYIENELIKYKRTHDEQLQTINLLRLREQDFQQQITSLQVLDSELKNKNTQLQTKIENLEQVLDSTRHQLNQKLSEIETVHLRLKMLEKLNTSLSLSLKDYPG